MHSPTWFTPTGVGTMISPGMARSSATVHPHGRGDNPCPLGVFAIGCGSPPRAWGQLQRGIDNPEGVRFTPTGVGTITPLSHETVCHPVHPHGRGDNAENLRYRRYVLGSPPRAWGQCPSSPVPSRCSRFTPTGVGTMQNVVCCASQCPVHPHGRGDNNPDATDLEHEFGSPPRAWGQCCRGRLQRGEVRFTPTGVGTMCSCTSCSAWWSVHPHGRGDNRV